MTFQIELAKKEKVKLLVGLTGPSGAGKTLSALYLARGIVSGEMSKVLVIDTENKSSSYYADRDDVGKFNQIEFNPEYHPARYVEAIAEAEAAAGIEVVIIDSISHEWDGKGGCLEIVSGMSGNSFTAWKHVTPLHNSFIDKMRTSRLHVIATMRSKSDYVIEQNDKGKSVPKKVGLKSTQRENVDYEFGVVFDINIAHYAESSKDRTGVFMPKGPFKITEETGKELLAWANSGAEPELEKYDKTNDQHRILLKSIFDEFKISDVQTMIGIATEFDGKVPVVELKRSVANWRVGVSH